MAVRYIPTNIRGLKFVEQASWAGGDPGAGYTALKAFDIEFDPEQNTIEPEYQKPEANRGPDDLIAAGKGGTLTFKTYLRGGAGSESEFSLLAKNCGLDRNANDAVADDVASATASTLVVDSATMTEITGDAVMVNDTDTDTQIRFISRKQEGTPVGDTTFAIEPNWSDTPAASDDLLDIDTFTPRGSALGEPTKYMTFQFYEGDGTTNRHLWTLTGCAGTFKISTVEANKVPILEWTYMVDAWSTAESNTADTADSYEPAHPMLSSPVYIDDTETKIKSFSFDPGLQIAPMAYQGGTHGRAGRLYHASQPVLTFSTLWDVDYLSDWTTPTAFQFFTESIKDTDEGWAFYAPSVMIKKPAPTEIDSHKGMEMELVLTDPGQDADDANIPLWAIAITGSGS